MKNLKLFFILGLFLILVTGFSQKQEKVEIIPGTEIQGGIGQFADPFTLHGTTVSLNGNLGVSNKTNTFGYDIFTVSARYVPGSTGIGNRIAIQYGASNWFTPALETVYSDSVLMDDENNTESSIVNSLMVGFGFRLFQSRIPTDADWANNQDSISFYDLAEFNSLNNLEKDSIRKLQTKFKWLKIQRPAYRRPTAMAGALFRIGTLGLESDVEVTDFYFSFAAGKGLFDFVSSAHFLLPLSSELICKNALTGTLGFFLDLDSEPIFERDKSPSIRTLGLTLSLGNYNYNEKSKEYSIQEEIIYTYYESPSTTRFDITLSFNGLLGNLGPFGSGIGFKYSHLWHSSGEMESQYQIQFTSKFLAEKNNK